jgi:predicted HTH domain antitoxin
LSVTITLPDLPEAARLDAAELRLELACALYARGRVGKIAATEMAGVDFFTFQRALEERGIPLYSEQMLADDVQTLKTLFPR